MRIIFIILCTTLLVLTGCTQHPVEAESNNSLDSLPVQNSEDTKNPYNTERDMSRYENGKASASFLSIESSWVLHDGILYYKDPQDHGRVWKYNMGSAEKEYFLLPDEYRFASGLNQDGYFFGLKNRSGITERGILNINDGLFEKIDWLSSINSFQMALYKGNIFLVDMENGFGSLDMYDLYGNHKKAICPDYVENFGIIDDSVYFHPFLEDLNNKDAHGNKIMRFDITTGEIETAFEFEIGKEPQLGGGRTIYEYQPYTYYDKRNIIIANKRQTFVYTSVDDIDLKEIVFESSSDFDFPYYVPSIGDNLYFCFYNADERDTEGDLFGYYEYYIVIQGTTEPIKLKQFDYADAMFFMDGYLYYLDEDGNIAQEWMHD